MRGVLPALLAATLACVSTPTIRPFREADYAPYRTGTLATATLSGQAFMKTRGGELRYAAGNIVILEPATPHTEDIVRALVTGQAAGPGDPRVKEFQKTTIADAEGRFRFTDLAAGEYIAKTYVLWEYSDRWGTHSTGGWIYNRVKVSPGESATVVVTTTHL